MNFDNFNYETQASKNTPWIGKSCHGVGEAYFLDGVHGGCSKDVLDPDWGVEEQGDLKEPNDSANDDKEKGKDDDDDDGEDEEVEESEV